MKKRFNAYGSHTVLLFKVEQLDREAIRQKKIEMENLRTIQQKDYTPKNDHFSNGYHPPLEDMMISTPCPQCKGNNVSTEYFEEPFGEKILTHEIIVVDPPLELGKMHQEPLYTLIRFDFPVCRECERKFGKEAILDCL